ncbi:hypothetical protein GOP47_0024925 [Adiantum capillus-veneris]|uniref:Uncharacterized protein n=1 Tax=Adiantum capillus-veneris TaxID=13818 RepID=A0A9D4Z432_ADICA|nr:hypothetical protein GOP47_0024925 [Adiantum capillus-veneris]
MNRDVGRGTDTVQQDTSSNYLIYLFVFSALFVVLLPYVIPFGGSLLRSSKKETVQKLKGQSVKSSEPYSLFTYPSLSTDSLVSRQYNYENKQDEITMLIVELQRTIQIERERMFQLENEIRILHLSERYLKERVQKLEDRDLEHRRSFSAGSAPIELLMEKTLAAQNKQDNMDGYLQELLKMLQAEKERVNALAMEVRMLRMSESVLVDRVKTLEDKFNEFLLKSGQNKHFDSKYEKRDLTQN